jgi:hypothetical protein
VHFVSDFARAHFPDQPSRNRGESESRESVKWVLRCILIQRFSGWKKSSKLKVLAPDLATE